MTAGIPAVIAGELPGSIGNQGDLIGLNGHNQIQEIRSGIPLNIEFRGDHRFEIIDIETADMPLVGPGMHGDPLGTKTLTIHRNLHYIRDLSPLAFRSVAILFIFTLSRVILLILKLQVTTLTSNRKISAFGSIG